MDQKTPKDAEASTAPGTLLNPIFGPAPSHEAIVRALDDDKFLAVAYLMIGMPDIWESAVYEVADLYERFEREGADPKPLHLLIDWLAYRTSAMPDRESARQKLQVAFGIFVPPNPKLVRIDAYWQKWRDDYKSSRDK